MMDWYVFNFECIIIECKAFAIDTRK